MTLENQPLWRIPQWFQQLDAKHLDQLKHYHAELLKFNKAISLISGNTIENADQVHFSDSILAWKLIEPKIPPGANVYDIGSGNGFPGIVAAILSKNHSFTLIDSDSRKIEFLKHIISSLDITNVTTICNRIESLGGSQIQYGINRAFANISKTLLTLRKSMAPKGTIFHFKGPEWVSEIANMPQQLCSTWNTNFVAEYGIPETQIKHSIICSELV